jgi:hypothetical protein
VLRAVAAQPARMAIIANDRVRDAILTSHDQGFAVDMMLRTEAGVDPARLMRELRAAWDGTIQPILVYEKHPSLVYVAGGLALLLLALLRRLFRPRRARPLAT